MHYFYRSSTSWSASGCSRPRTSGGRHKYESVRAPQPVAAHDGQPREPLHENYYSSSDVRNEHESHNAFEHSGLLFALGDRTAGAQACQRAQRMANRAATRCWYWSCGAMLLVAATERATVAAAAAGGRAAGAGTRATAAVAEARARTTWFLVLGTIGTYVQYVASMLAFLSRAHKKIKCLNK